MANRYQKIRALRLKYEAEIAEAKADIETYLDNSVGVAEHTRIIESIDSLMSSLADSEDKLQSLRRYFETTLYKNDTNS